MQRGKRNKKNIKNNPDVAIWKKGFKGLCIAYLVTLIGLLIGTSIFYYGWLSPGWMNGIGKLIMILSMFAGAFYIFKVTAGKDRIWILIVLIAYLLLRFLLSLILTF